MPGILDPAQVGKREWLAEVIFLSDVKKTVFLSAARKQKPGYGKKGIPNMLGEYQVKKLGDRKPGGVADGKDVSAFDSNPARQMIQFRAEKYRRAPMVGDIAEGNEVAGITSEFAEAVSDQLVEHKRDMEKETLGDQDSSPTGGAEGGSVTRALGRWINNTALSSGALSYGELPVPASYQTPVGQIFTGSIGDGISTGLTEQSFGDLLQKRWEATGDSGQLMGFVGSAIKTRVGLFSRYVPNVANATPIVRTSTADYNGGTLFGPSVDLYKSDWGSFTLMPVVTDFLPDAYRAYFLDMSQIEIRSRYWCREKNLPDLGGGPRELIESIIALIPGDPRSHVKIAGAP